ncbi:MAG TPA: glycosyl hydrolase family 8 [Thermoleophilaceae bacterium]
MRRFVAVVCLVVVAGCGGSSPPSQQELAQRDAARFLDRFVDSNGRVVRRDQGGDTVSEGQAYAMLLAVATNDRATFARVWNWTRRNLQRDDLLLSWHWQRGHVDDDSPSADADLDAAHALALAARRFKQPGYATEARRMGAAIRATETIDTPAGGVLAAGPWSTPQRLANPSYTDPGAIKTLGKLGDGASWQRLATASKRMVGSVAHAGSLPPDWAKVMDDGSAAPSSPPGTSGAAEYSFDAARVPIRFAASCTLDGRRLAAQLWPRLRVQPALLPRKLGGAPAPQAQPSAVGLAGAAAAAAAAGKPDTAARLLDQASASERKHPNYFGSAIVALTRAGVMTPMLGSCR